ncbi:predicted protein [Streptomyces viridosporus ATCC 14672]|uniref:Predicted protein n=1 Tax=Streptomyces viridosporus (strain ATCC 14672 / DSM 40746 / JCM 4963 / KCTC 9882 / NRRL B-12104 / FH 1290) TaxID=566461 RepID=D6A0Z3_STRV1|nr:predicted protein [Streptomyces viridosporus ATCC 14672]
MADVATSPPGTRATLTGPRRRPPWTTARARLHPYDAELRLTARRLAHRRFLTVSTATAPSPPGVQPQRARGRAARPYRRPRRGALARLGVLDPAGTAPTGPTTTDRTPPGPGRTARARTLTGDARERRPTDGRAAATAPWNVMPRQVRFPRREFVPDAAARPTTDARDGYRAGRLPDRPGPDRPRRSPLHGRLLRHRGRRARAAARPMPRDVSRHAPVTAHDAPSPTKARKFTVRHITPGSVGKA